MERGVHSIIYLASIRDECMRVCGLKKEGTDGCFKFLLGTNVFEINRNAQQTHDEASERDETWSQGLPLTSRYGERHEVTGSGTIPPLQARKREEANVIRMRINHGSKARCASDELVSKRGDMRPMRASISPSDRESVGLGTHDTCRRNLRLRTVWCHLASVTLFLAIFFNQCCYYVCASHINCDLNNEYNAVFFCYGFLTGWQFLAEFFVSIDIFITFWRN